MFLRPWSPCQNLLRRPSLLYQFQRYRKDPWFVMQCFLWVHWRLPLIYWMLQDRVGTSHFDVHVWALHCRVSDPRQWTYLPGKDKAIPLQAWTGPEGSRGMRLPDFKTVGTWRWEGCQTYAPAAFTPRKYSCYSFLLEAESTPGTQCGRKDYVDEKFQWHIGNRTRDHTVCSAVPQPTAPPRAPVFLADDLIVFWLFTHSSYVWLLRTAE